ncbi:hypothetical protein CEXT_11171 [Caerostris extrusa]|uniref:Uncharacterized protein n=1 Tax=Caerostris extrusa TaxID=172846 RepID=A0AAV4XI70_CAEEX|nr:hypothetical protein CEXT_11171 [Caerostris extrusa]
MHRKNAKNHSEHRKKEEESTPSLHKIKEEESEEEKKKSLFVRLTDRECPLWKGSTNLYDDCSLPPPRHPLLPNDFQELLTLDHSNLGFLSSLFKFVRLTDLECPLWKGSTNLYDVCPPPPFLLPPSYAKRFLGASSSRPP